MARKPAIYLALLYIILSCSKDSENLLISEAYTLPEQEEMIPEVEETKSPEENHSVYNWIEQMQLQNGLMESAEDTDFVSLYDNALAAMNFLASGDVEKAEKIFDYFNARIEIELEYGTGGFYQFRDVRGDNRRTRWLGDNAWFLIALNNYKAITGFDKYDYLRLKLEDWIRSLQDTDGGLWGGYREDGTQFHKITEGILIAFEAVEGYDDFHRGILQFLKEQRWNATDNLLVAWPENQQYYYSLDLLPLAYMVFDDFPTTVLANANRFLTEQVSTITAAQVVGYSFDEDRDVIWLEGTAQMGLAFHKAGQLDQQERLIQNLDKMAIADDKNTGVFGLPYASNEGSCYGAVQLWDHADKKAALSSSIWYMFNKNEFNPFEQGPDKNIPEIDKFWVKNLPMN